MKIPWNRRRPNLPALLALAMLLTLAPAARATDDAGSGGVDEGWKKVIAYARCAFEMFIAATPIQWTAAILDCSKQYLDEPRLRSGGV